MRLPGSHEEEAADGVQAEAGKAQEDHQHPSAAAGDAVLRERSSG